MAESVREWSELQLKQFDSLRSEILANQRYRLQLLGLLVVATAGLVGVGEKLGAADTRVATFGVALYIVMIPAQVMTIYFTQQTGRIAAYLRVFYEVSGGILWETALRLLREEQRPLRFRQTLVAVYSFLSVFPLVGFWLVRKSQQQGFALVAAIFCVTFALNVVLYRYRGAARFEMWLRRNRDRIQGEATGQHQ